jgi:hypothetical protein
MSPAYLLGMKTTLTPSMIAFLRHVSDGSNPAPRQRAATMEKAIADGLVARAFRRDSEGCIVGATLALTDAGKAEIVVEAVAVASDALDTYRADQAAYFAAERAAEDMAAAEQEAGRVVARAQYEARKAAFAARAAAVAS